MTKAEKTRQFIIEKAAPIFNKKGIAGTAISDIMEATQLAKGGVYGNFENKDEICLAVFNYLINAINAEINQRISQQETASEKLSVILDYHYQNLLKSEYGGCPLLNFGIEADDTYPWIKQRVCESIKYSQSRISNIVSQGIASGEFKVTFDAELFAIKMFAMVEGAVFMSKSQNSSLPMQVIINILKTEIAQNLK